MPKSLVFYRTSAAVRITPDMRRGVFWVEGALSLPDAPKGVPEKGIPKYNWQEKLIIALSPEEALQLAECAERIRIFKEGKIEFFHDPVKGGREGEPKKLLLSYEGKTKKVFLSVTQSDARRISAVLGGSDLFSLSSLVPLAVGAMWDWTGSLPSYESQPEEEPPPIGDGDF